METIILKLAVALLIISFIYGFIKHDLYFLTYRLNDFLGRFIDGTVYLIFAIAVELMVACFIHGIMFIIKG